jgi:hypothetical protein
MTAGDSARLVTKRREPPPRKSKRRRKRPLSAIMWRPFRSARRRSA